MSAARQIRDLLGLRRPPVGVTFRAAAPAGVPRVDRAGPSSCSSWKLAAERRTFYTEAPDDELYFVFPGKQVAAVAEKLATIVRANNELEKYHRARCSAG